MARIKNGILGGFSGKVGEVIGQNYAGVSTMRAMPKYVTNPKTDAQIAHRSLFAQLSSLMAATQNILQYSIENKNKVYNGFNRNLQFNWRTAIMTSEIDYSKLTFGTFWGQPLDDVTIGNVEDSQDYPGFKCCEISWRSYINNVNKFPNDQIILISILRRELPGGGYYTFVSNSTVLSSTRGADGVTGSEVVPLIASKDYDSKDEFMIYLGVNSPDTEEAYQECKSTIRIPAHNIPAFRPASSFVQEVKDNNSGYQFDYRYGPWRDRPAYHGSAT